VTTTATGQPGAATGGAPATRHYDIVKEFVIAFVVVAVLTAGLAALFSSPDEQPITIASWARADPADFTATAAAELAGTSDSAGYGPPYNTATTGQQLGPLKLAHWFGVTQPADSARDFVLAPLAAATGHDPALAAALAIYTTASAGQQATWATAYAAALAKAPGGDPASVPPNGAYGPVPLLTSRLTTLAQTGALDAALQSQGGFYNTDYTKSLLYLADSGYLAARADTQHLSGDQWGMMNETGNFPGQAWLWLYTFWYQIKPFSTSGNADALVWGLMALLSLAFILIPYIPGIRSIPRLIPIYRLIWRTHYHTQHTTPQQ
jgi:hypothetical protein